MPGAPSHDWAALIAAKNKEVQRLNGVYQKILGNAKVTYIEGRGRVVDPHTVEVGGQRYTAKNILIATGGRSSVPDIPGKELGIASDDALELPALPKSIVIVGAGYIALEFACIFAGYGSQVDVVYRGDLPLRGFDQDVQRFVADSLAAKGIRLRPGESPASVSGAPGALTLHTAGGGAYPAEVVMFATGRAPNTRGLGLEALGVRLKKGGAIDVDEYSRTAVPSIWAVGDVTDRINLTPVALMEGMALAATLFKGAPTKPDYENVPAAVFLQPPVGTVGLTEAQAVERVGDVDIYLTTFKPMKFSLAGRDEKYLMKLVVDAKSDKVLGVHIVGTDAPEMLQGFAVALKCGATKKQFDSCVGIHPTSAEEMVTMRSVTRQIRAAPKL